MGDNNNIKMKTLNKLKFKDHGGGTENPGRDMTVPNKALWQRRMSQFSATYFSLN